jgi:hypothetical protein
VTGSSFSTMPIRSPAAGSPKATIARRRRQATGADTSRWPPGYRFFGPTGPAHRAEKHPTLAMTRVRPWLDDLVVDEPRRAVTAARWVGSRRVAACALIDEHCDQTAADDEDFQPDKEFRRSRASEYAHSTHVVPVQPCAGQGARRSAPTHAGCLLSGAAPVTA